MKQRNYKLPIAKDVTMALCIGVLDIYFWCQIFEDKSIWILAVGFAFFTVSHILDIIHDIKECRVFNEEGELQRRQNRLSLIIDICGCAVLIIWFIIMCCDIFGN